MDDEARSRSLARMAERISKEAETLPYRWGYFQGVVLVPCSLLIISSVVSDLLVPRRYPWYLLTIGFLMGLFGFPLAYGLLRKRAVALALVYAMLGLTLLLVAIRIPVAIKHFADPSEKLSISFDIELLFKNTSVGMFAALVTVLNHGPNVPITRRRQSQNCHNLAIKANRSMF